MRSAAEYVKSNIAGPLKVVEVGVAHGLNAIDMLNNMNIEKMYLVDPYIEYSDDGNDTPGKRSTATQSEMDTAQKNMILAIKQFENNTIIVNESSPAAAVSFPDGSLDFVYIDCCHFKPQVEADIAAWWPKVRAGGVLGGHDYITPVPAVEASVTTIPMPDGTEITHSNAAQPAMMRDDHPGVTSSVDEFVADNGLVLLTGPGGQETDWYIQK